MRIRFLSTISLLLFFASVLKAQDTTNKFRIGLTTSLEKNMSSERTVLRQYSVISNKYNKVNYGFGLNLEYKLKNDLTVNGAIMYSNKDFTGTYFQDVREFVGPQGPEDIDFDFIEVPITMKYYFLPDKIRLFGEIGFNNFFALNDLIFKEGVKSFVIGFKIGGGMEYNLSRKLALQLSIDYNNSISKMFKDSNFKINSLNFGIGIMKKI